MVDVDFLIESALNESDDFRLDFGLDRADSGVDISGCDFDSLGVDLGDGADDRDEEEDGASDSSLKLDSDEAVLEEVQVLE